MKKLSIIPFVFIFYFVNAQDDVKLNGYNYIYYPNKSIQSEGILVDGKPEGLWINYYPTGVKKSEGRWRNSLLDSTWVFFTLSGDTSSKIAYTNGLKSGYTTEYYTNAENPIFNGNIKRKLLYINNKIEGKSYTYYEDGSLSEENMYVSNYKEGLCFKFSKEGRLITIFNYRKGSITEREKINRFNKEGNKDGLWREFYDGYRIKSECRYKNGLLDGYYKEYTSKGELIRTILYKNNEVVKELDEENVKSNVVQEFYDNGNIKSKGSFKNSKPIGVHKFYSKDGSIIQAKIYSDESILLQEGPVDTNGYRIGNWIDYYDNGKIKAKGKYKKNRKEGNWEFYYKNGHQEQRGEYENGKYSGLWTWYYDDGSVWKEEEFYNGKNEGSYVEYSRDDIILVEGDYFDGEREGKWITEINDNKAVGVYINGLMNGVWKHYYDDGQISFEGNYIQGTPDGKHKYYYSNGNLKEEQFYNNGIKQKHWKKYSEDGHLFLTITYKNDKEYRINGVKIELPEDIVPTVIE